MKLIIVFLMFCTFFNYSQTADKSKTKGQDDKVKLKEALMPAGPIKSLYETGGRRDPFISLLRDLIQKNTKNELPPGLPGLMIEEIKLEGIMRFKNVYYANFVGPDNKPYLVSKGDRLYDGEVIDIQLDAVTFRKELTTRIEGKKERIVVVKLDPGDLNSQGGKK